MQKESICHKTNFLCFFVITVKNAHEKTILFDTEERILADNIRGVQTQWTLPLDPELENL